jgi:hypothetical protein
MKTFSWFCPEANKAEIVSSVGIGMTEDNIPFTKRPSKPYFVNSKATEVGIAKFSID